MCGIAGIWTSKDQKTSRKQLKTLADTMVHRGPDEEGFFISPNRRVGLAHRRLKVIDLAGGRQPISNEDGSKTLVFNGEIYNYQNLRKSLIERGHRFSSNSDTEVIVHLYEEHGTACVDYLRGMFSFVIYDETEQLLFGAIDRMGKKPLYYHSNNISFCFASTFQALVAFPSVTRDLDPTAFDQFLSLTYIPAPRTIFTSVKKLQAGHFFVWKKGDLKLRRYWDIPKGPKIDISLDEAKKITFQKIEEAVKLRLISDVPLGAFLSGGLDSSLIVALAARHTTGKLDTFSIGFEDPSYNELPFAKTVSQAFNTYHHEFMVKPLEVDNLPQLVRHFGEPYGDFSALPMWRLAQETRKYVTVALSGDGGDELFAGYGRHRAFELYNMIRLLLPGGITGPISGFLGMPHSKNPIKRKFQRLFQIINQPPGMIFADLNIFLKPWQKTQAYTQQLKSLLSVSVEEALSNIFERGAGTNLDRMLYTDTLTYEVCQLTKVDVMTMAWSLEARCPLVDQELVELVFSLPDHYKMKHNGGKRILKEIGKTLLPPEILNRPKQGFTIPLKHWFRQDIKDYAREKILNGKLRELGWINETFLRVVLGGHFDASRDYTYLVWNFLVLSEWLDLYF